MANQQQKPQQGQQGKKDQDNTKGGMKQGDQGQGDQGGQRQGGKSAQQDKQKGQQQH